MVRRKDNGDIMYNPLRKKIYEADTRFFDVVIRRGITVVNVFLKTDITSAVEFYRAYRDKIAEPNNGCALLKKNRPEIFELYQQYLRNNHKHVGGWVTDIYNEWLFDYCFGDVLEE